ncbi:MAG TPA: hypothetical protein VK066_08850 [Chloroflexota bacterium]|nr:hypothetical protein [Chloroflexota bacterium]
MYRIIPELLTAPPIFPPRPEPLSALASAAPSAPLTEVVTPPAAQ